MRDRGDATRLDGVKAPRESIAMNALVIVVLAQLVAPGRPALPVLSFPEAGLDDSAAYQGYQTRFYRDVAGNTVQIYLDRRTGRVVHLWADAEDESLGFSVRDARGAPALRWEGSEANVSGSGRMRTLEYRLTADGALVNVGWFLLGSMRVERDFQYARKYRDPFSAKPFVLPEIDRLLVELGRLELPERRSHLAMLHARDVETLTARLRPSSSTHRSASSWIARVVQPSLAGLDTLVLELRVDPRGVVASRAGDSLTFRARSGRVVPFTVRISTTGKPLTRLTRDEIFSSEFLAFLASVDTSATRARWLERQVRGVELLSSREKLMAGLPAYATYFGRDMLLSALMMRPIWRDEMSEFVIASALRKLSPRGDVSHEEALGGQAVREAAGEYAALIGEYLAAAQRGDRVVADSLLARAKAVLRDVRRVRENYHMIDDEFQLPVLAARWLADPHVTPERKRAFLLDKTDNGESRAARLLRELALVSRMTAAYVANPIATNLVSFAPRDSACWSSASWRDSGAGYACGRFAMDVNAIWAPHALEAIAVILGTSRTIGISMDSLAGAMPELSANTPLGTYARDSTALRRAIDAWWGASRHFLIRLSPAEVHSKVTARIAAMPDQERAYWLQLLTTSVDRDSVVFLALSLDAQGLPIGVANTDPATRLFLGNGRHAWEPHAAVTDTSDLRADLRDVELFVRNYPVGLFIDRVGPVVANDAYASPTIWREFERDQYHGPRVVWGREVNLFLLGVANRLAAASSGDEAYVRQLRDAVDKVQSAVQASGFHSELWSYEFRGGRPEPVRYGTGSDVQLWSTTDLAVQFALSRLPR